LGDILIRSRRFFRHTAHGTAANKHALSREAVDDDLAAPLPQCLWRILLSLAPWQAEPSVKSNPFCVPDKIYEAVPIVSPADAIEFDQPAPKYDFWWLHRFVAVLRELSENFQQCENLAWPWR